MHIAIMFYVLLHPFPSDLQQQGVISGAQKRDSKSKLCHEELLIYLSE